MPLLELRNVSKSFPGPRGLIPAVQDLSLSLSAGELLVLTGPSGCGKSTTLRLAAGLEPATTGEVLLDGTPVGRIPPADRDIALAFQSPALYPHLSARENLAFALKVRKVPSAEAARRIEEVASWLSLDPCLDRLPGQLSGGECQRLALGRALIRRPKLLLLDEPLSHLDAPLRWSLRLEVARLQRRLGFTLIYVTHDQAEAMTLGDRIALLRAGALQQVAPPAALYHHPANEFAARFFGSPPMNILPGVIQSGPSGFSFRADGLEITLANQRFASSSTSTEVPARLGLRPENVLLNPVPSPQIPCFPAQVEFTHDLGPERHVYLTTPQTKWVARASADAANLHPGAPVQIGLQIANALFFDPQTGTRLPKPTVN